MQHKHNIYIYAYYDLWNVSIKVSTVKNVKNVNATVRYVDFNLVHDMTKQTMSAIRQIYKHRHFRMCMQGIQQMINLE